MNIVSITTTKHILLYIVYNCLLSLLFCFSVQFQQQKCNCLLNFIHLLSSLINRIIQSKINSHHNRTEDLLVACNEIESSYYYFFFLQILCQRFLEYASMDLRQIFRDDRYSLKLYTYFFVFRYVEYYVIY